MNLEMKEGLYRSYFSTIAKDMIFTGRLHKEDDKIEKSIFIKVCGLLLL